MHTFTRLEIFNRYFIDLVCNALKTAYDPEIALNFIYNDRNFERFFLSKLRKSNVYVFYSTNFENDKMSGFVFFEVIDNVLYLRNILIDHEFIDQGLGGNLFTNALSVITDEHPSLTLLQVDAFEKNAAAIKWYRDLGMVVTHCLYWYDVSTLFNTLQLKEPEASNKIALITDEFGLQHLIDSGNEIGDLINNDHLVIKINPTPKQFSHIQTFFNAHQLSSVCLISVEKLDLDICHLATSVYLAGEFSNLALPGY